MKGFDVVNAQSPQVIQRQIEEMNALRKANPNIFSRDLSFEISCLESLYRGVEAKYDNHDCQLMYVPGKGLHLQLPEVLLARSFPCGNISLNGDLLVEKCGCAQARWKIDDSILKSVSFLPVKNVVLISRCHLTQYNPKSELPLRAVLQFPGKISVIQFFNYFFGGDENEIGVVVDSHSSMSCVINGIRFLFGGKSYLFYSYVDNSHDSNYLVIESMDLVGWQAFTNVSRRILHVVGFLTGHFRFGPFFLFVLHGDSASELVGYENSLPPPCELFYTMTGMNPYSYFATSDINHGTPDAESDKTSPIEKLRPELKPFRKQHVEKLMELLDDPYFSFLFYTFVENSISQHMRMASSRLMAYATCLEIGGNWFKEKAASEGKRTNPDFLPEKIRDELSSRLQEAVDDYVKCLETTGRTGIEDIISEMPNKDAKEILLDKLRIVRRRVESELFKQTNAEKLSVQFRENGITLSDSEVKLLDGRNKILHGADAINLPFDPENPEPYIEVSERKCFEYYALIWRLIMHVIGYEGVFRDEASVQTSFRTHRSNSGEPFVRKI